MIGQMTEALGMIEIRAGEQKDKIGLSKELWKTFRKTSISIKARARTMF